MSDLTLALEKLQNVFDKYSGREGDKETLTKGELCELLRNEHLGAENLQKPDVEKFFNMLDNDKDGLINFQEYVSFVANLTLLLRTK